MKKILFTAVAGVWLAITASLAAASPMTFFGSLAGNKESPPNASTGTGTVTVLFDMATHALTIDTDFSGLLAPTTVSHIHCCTAAPASGTATVATMLPTFIGFPAGVASGSYEASFNTSLASFWNPNFIATHGGTTASAEAALLAGLLGHEAYFNIHSTAFQGGEIRAFLDVVPLPAPAGTMLLGLPLLFLARRRRPA